MISFCHATSIKQTLMTTQQTNTSLHHRYIVHVSKSTLVMCYLLEQTFIQRNTQRVF